MGIEKKVVEYLYIDADEDHISLQFKEKKWNLETGENHWKNNSVLTKQIYVYEGIKREVPYAGTGQTARARVCYDGKDSISISCGNT